MELYNLSKKIVTKEEGENFINILRSTFDGAKKFDINKKDTQGKTILDNLLKIRKNDDDRVDYPPFEVINSVMCYPGIDIDYDKIAYFFYSEENALLIKIFKQYIKTYHFENAGVNRLYNLNFDKNKKKHITATFLMINSLNSDLRNKEICKYLLDNGADPNIRNNKNMRALDYAILNDDTESIPLLAKSVSETDYIRNVPVDKDYIMKMLLLNMNDISNEDLEYAYKKFPHIKKEIETKRSALNKVNALRKNDNLGVLSGIHTDFKEYLIEKLNASNKDLLFIRGEMFTIDELLDHLSFGNKARWYTSEELNMMREFVIDTGNQRYKNAWNDLKRPNNLINLI